MYNMIEIEHHKIYIKQYIRPILFKVLQTISKWKVMFPELNENIQQLIVKMSLLTKKRGHIFCEIINGDRVISVPSIEDQFLNICAHFIKKGVLIKPVNEELHNDIEIIINLTRDLTYNQI